MDGAPALLLFQEHDPGHAPDRRSLRPLARQARADPGCGGRADLVPRPERADLRRRGRGRRPQHDIDHLLFQAQGAARRRRPRPGGAAAGRHRRGRGPRAGPPRPRRRLPRPAPGARTPGARGRGPPHRHPLRDPGAGRSSAPGADRPLQGDARAGGGLLRRRARGRGPAPRRRLRAGAAGRHPLDAGLAAPLPHRGFRPGARADGRPAGRRPRRARGRLGAAPAGHRPARGARPLRRAGARGLPARRHGAGERARLPRRLGRADRGAAQRLQGQLLPSPRGQGRPGDELLRPQLRARGPRPDPGDGAARNGVGAAGRLRGRAARPPVGTPWRT